MCFKFSQTREFISKHLIKAYRLDTTRRLITFKLDLNTIDITYIDMEGYHKFCIDTDLLKYLVDIPEYIDTYNIIQKECLRHLPKDSEIIRMDVYETAIPIEYILYNTDIFCTYRISDLCEPINNKMAGWY